MTQNKEMPKEIYAYKTSVEQSWYLDPVKIDRSARYIRADVVEGLNRIIDFSKQTIDNLLDGIATAEENSLVDVEGLKTHIMDMWYDTDIDLQFGDGVCRTMDYLAEQGYLRQPQDNAEALEALDAIDLEFMKPEHKQRSIAEYIETIRKGLNK